MMIRSVEPLVKNSDLFPPPNFAWQDATEEAHNRLEAVHRKSSFMEISVSSAASSPAM